MKKLKKGFTLVELLITITIMGEHPGKITNY